MTALNFAFVREVVLVHFVPSVEVMIVPFPPTETKREEIPSESELVSSVKSVSSVSSATEALSFEKSSYHLVMSSLYQ